MNELVCVTGEMPAINYKHKIVVENVRGLAQNNEKLASTRRFNR